MTRLGASIIMTLISIGVFSQKNINIENLVKQITANCNEAKFGKDSIKTVLNTSLYREFYDNKNYKEALPYWKYLIENAPKSSENLYIRGVKMYKYFLKNDEDINKDSTKDTILALQDIRLYCFGKSAKKLKNKTFDWYSYRKKGNEKFVLDLFYTTFEQYNKEKKSIPINFLSYYVDLAINSHKKGMIISDEVVSIFSKVNEEIEKNIEGEKKVEYTSLQNNIIVKLNKEGIIDCENILPVVENTYQTNPNDTIVILKSYKKLKALSCTENKLFLEIAVKVSEIKPSVAIFKYLARKTEKDVDIDKVILYINKAIEISQDDIQKEKLTMKIASIYYSQFKLSKAREFANKALKINPNSGKAYLTIGRTYASSGKICGTGTDFKSHTIVWAAIDVWKKAIAVDKSVQAEAQKLINKYIQYMPTKQELFLNNITIGSRYTISCFGFTTTVRSSD